MNRTSFTTVFVIVVIIFSACVKPKNIDPVISNKILVDASKDGGGWWFPQGGSPNFSTTAEHQGKKLADYLRTLGYQVDELPRGSVVTWNQLKEYTKIIRAHSMGDYSPLEIAAYDSFLSRPSSLMLISEYLRDNERDNLSEHLGLNLAGILQGTVAKFFPHPITAGVNSINYIAGSSLSGIIKSDKITVLGWLNTNNAPVMGILQHPKARIFFIGDINGLEQVPQPFVSNLVKWLF